MKKILFMSCLFIMLIPFIVKAETCDQEKITISSITLEDKSSNVKELDKATANNKNINLNLSMSKLGDNIKYKVIFKNDSNEDYELDKNNLKISSNYIDYVFESEDNSNIVKANSSKTVFLKIKYANEVSKDEFENGTFNDNKTMTLSLASHNKLKNPNTGIQLYILIVVSIILIGFTIYLIIRKKKYAKLMILIIGITIVIPISAYALCKYNIKIESNIEIKNNTFTGTLYRYNNISLKHGSNISGYLRKSSNVYRNALFNSKEECTSNIINDEVCEKVQDSIFNYPGFSKDKESLDKYVYLRHEVINDIVKSTHICYIDDSKEYCMQGGDNGASFSSNEQVIRDFNHYNSYCTISAYDDKFGCSGSYGMEMYTYMNGKISAYYIFGVGCDVESNSTSTCWNY